MFVLDWYLICMLYVASTFRGSHTMKGLIHCTHVQEIILFLRKENTLCIYCLLTLVYIEVDLIQVHSHVVMWEFWKKGYMHKMHGTLLLKEFLIKMKVWTLWYNKRSSPKWVNYTYAHLHLRMLSFWSVNFKNFHFSPKWVHIIISSLSII